MMQSPPPGKMRAMMQSRPMAFMRGLTFPGGQQPVIRGQDVYLRYPRIADYRQLGAAARREPGISHQMGAGLGR